MKAGIFFTGTGPSSQRKTIYAMQLKQSRGLGVRHFCFRLVRIKFGKEKGYVPQTKRYVLGNE